jgi:hypothetical protein
MRIVELAPNSSTMHIEFMRSGGFANIPLRCTVDTDALAPEQRHALEGKVEEANFFALPPTLGAGIMAADMFHYHVTVRTGGRSHTVAVSGGAVPDAVQDPIEVLTRMARAGRRSSGPAHSGGASA